MLTVRNREMAAACEAATESSAGGGGGCATIASADRAHATSAGLAPTLATAVALCAGAPRSPIGRGSGRGRLHYLGTLSRQKEVLARQLNASWRKRLAGVRRREKVKENTA